MLVEELIKYLEGHKEKNIQITLDRVTTIIEGDLGIENIDVKDFSVNILPNSIILGVDLGYIVNGDGYLCDYESSSLSYEEKLEEMVKVKEEVDDELTESDAKNDRLAEENEELEEELDEIKNDRYNRETDRNRLFYENVDLKREITFLKNKDN